MKENFKNESDIIMMMDRPLVMLENREIAEMATHAQQLARQAQAAAEPESFSAMMLWATASHMLQQVEKEIASRN